MAKSLVIYESRDQIAYIMMNRPEKMNALNTALSTELGKVWERFEKDSTVRVGILTGAGKAFCAGFDLSDVSQTAIEAHHRAFPMMGLHISKPVIAAIQGYCMGAGFALARSCDLRIASESAQFGLPESRSGLIDAGATGTLVHYIPFGIAMEIYLTGLPIGAQRAYEIGLVNKISADEDIITEATEMASLISKNAPLTMKAIKVRAYKQIRCPYSQAAEEARIEYLTLTKPQLESEDLKEAMRAFKEKREPQFKGR